MDKYWGEEKATEAESLRKLAMIAEDKVHEAEIVLEVLRGQAREPPMRFAEKEQECFVFCRDLLANVLRKRNLTFCGSCNRVTPRKDARYFISTEKLVNKDVVTSCGEGSCMPFGPVQEIVWVGGVHFMDQCGGRLPGIRDLSGSALTEGLGVLLEILDAVST